MRQVAKKVLCSTKNSPNSVAAFVAQNKSILLYTVRADVFNTETKTFVKIRLLDTESQRCFVKEKVQKNLNL